MQKKLIALAVASLASGAALAQTNVTVYGIADAGYVYSTGRCRQRPLPELLALPRSAATTPSAASSGLLSGSRLGFKRRGSPRQRPESRFYPRVLAGIDDNGGVGNTTRGLQFPPAVRRPVKATSSVPSPSVVNMLRAIRPRSTTTRRRRRSRADVLPVGPGRQHHHAGQRRALEQRHCLHHAELERLHRQG
jgi:hypothetical protein